MQRLARGPTFEAWSSMSVCVIDGDALQWADPPNSRAAGDDVHTGGDSVGTLFDARDRTRILDRLARLTPARRPLWGRFTAPAMVCHVSCALRQGLRVRHGAAGTRRRCAGSSSGSASADRPRRGRRARSSGASRGGAGARSSTSTSITTCASSASEGRAPTADRGVALAGRGCGTRTLRARFAGTAPVGERRRSAASRSTMPAERMAMTRPSRALWTAAASRPHLGGVLAA
jgi:hypothetical protein